MILVGMGKIGLNKRPSHMCFCPFECLCDCFVFFRAYVYVCVFDDKGGGLEKVG